MGHLLAISLIDMSDLLLYVIWMVFLNIALRCRILKELKISKGMELLFWTCAILLYSVYLSWDGSIFIVVKLFMLIILYINICSAHKKYWNGTAYIMIFLIVSVFFVFWTTVLFGKCYFQEGLVDVAFYEEKIDEIYEKYRFFFVFDFFISIIYFNIGIKKYFIAPKSISFIDIEFIQFIFGNIICGIIIMSVYDLIKKAIAPETKTKSIITENTMILNFMKLYSVGTEKVYTDCFFKILTSEFGVEIEIRNEFWQPRSVKLVVRIYKENEIILTWKDNKNINEESSIMCRYIVDETMFSQMPIGKYKVCLYINDKMVKTKHFWILQK